MGKSRYTAGKMAMVKHDEFVKLMRNIEFQKNIHHVINTPFEVVVLGTMKAGKSTLLNALLGRDLLPTDVDASTAIPYRIEDCDEDSKFRCREKKGNDTGNWQDATTKILSEWNKSEHIDEVEIRGNLPFVLNTSARVVLYDTPGPNNAINKRHGEITRNVLESQNYAMILYMLSTRQLCTDDEHNLLLELKRVLQSNSSRKKKGVIFVLSQADRFDQDKPEQSLPAVIARQKAFLVKHGFRKPQIMPVMAQSALLMRMKHFGQPMTQMQSDELFNANEHISRCKYSLLTHTDCSTVVQSVIRKRYYKSDNKVPAWKEAVSGIQGYSGGSPILRKRLLATGIPTLEACLQEKLFTEALPMTMLQISKVLRKHRVSHLRRWLSNE